MNFDFDSIVDRRDSGSYKWDSSDADVLPMWVADMDFRTAPCIIEALRRRVNHGVFGYTHVGDDYYSAIINWFKRRHGWNIAREWFIYTSGVVPAVSAIIKAVTRPGDKVITQTPAYNCFFSSIRNDECRLVDNRLIYDAETGQYSIDFEDLERLAADPAATALILCNPHNPSGRVWTAEELQHIADICLRNKVFVLIDEIHCELTYSPYKYIPYGTLPSKYLDNCAICISPSKAFNIAGLQIANIITPNASVRSAIDRAININEVCDVNPFGVTATIAAYNEGGSWLDALKKYLHDNYRLLCDTFSNGMPELKVTPLEGTYLAWVNISATGLTADEITKRLLTEKRLRINPGTMYGSGGEDFIRINMACRRSVLEDALQRMTEFFRSLLN